MSKVGWARRTGSSSKELRGAFGRHWKRIGPGAIALESRPLSRGPVRCISCRSLWAVGRWRLSSSMTSSSPMRMARRLQASPKASELFARPPRRHAVTSSLAPCALASISAVRGARRSATDTFNCCWAQNDAYWLVIAMSGAGWCSEALKWAARGVSKPQNSGLHVPRIALFFPLQTPESPLSVDLFFGSGKATSSSGDDLSSPFSAGRQDFGSCRKTERDPPGSNSRKRGGEVPEAALHGKGAEGYVWRRFCAANLMFKLVYHAYDIL